MTDAVIRAIKDALARKWSGHYATATAQVGGKVRDLDARDAYLAGLREGYWTGVLDAVAVEDAAEATESAPSDPDSN